MRGLAAELKTYHYMMEPGDATRYRFSLTFPEIGKAFFSRGVKFLGLADVPVKILDMDEHCILLGIYMPSWQGIYPTSLASLDNLDEGHIHYLANHMGAAGKSSWIYTIAAVCLAASVLVYDPLAVEAACIEMLKVPELLK